MEQQQTVGQRFTQLISHLGISKNAFAASLDKTATVIQHIVDERNKPGFDLLCKVFDAYPNVSKDWLLQGKGEMITNPSALSPVTRPSIPSVPVNAEQTEKGISTATLESSAPAPVALAETVSEPEPVATESAAKVQQHSDSVVAPVASLPTALPAAAAVLGTSSSVQESLQAALYAQQLAHQLTLAEMRNQHLQEQQRLMQQMMDMMQRQLTK
jgi:hypothetical protein